MKKFAALPTLLALVFPALAASPNRMPGTELRAHEGIAALYVTVLANQPGAALIRLTRKQFFGPADSFEVEFGTPTLVVHDLTEDSYEWYQALTTASGSSKLNLRGTLPGFKVGNNCVTYAGAVIIDLREKKAVVSFDHEGQVREQALTLLKERYPGELAKYGMCP